MKEMKRSNTSEDDITAGSVLSRPEGTKDPRLRRIMLSLVTSSCLVRDAELTEAEWFKAIQFHRNRTHVCTGQTPGIHFALRHAWHFNDC